MQNASEPFSLSRILFLSLPLNSNSILQGASKFARRLLNLSLLTQQKGKWEIRGTIEGLETFWSERMSITTKSRNLPKWHATPAPPPSPKILNLPRRHRRKQPKKASAKPPPSAEDCRGKLECLFDQERLFPRTVPTVCLDPATGESESREMVGGHEEKGEFSEEKWRFEAEILRAECNLLRIERDFALKKLERNRVQMGRTLQSAIQTLITGRNKICSGKSASSVMEEEIEVSVGQLKELQGRFTVEDFKVKNCCNLDKKATLLQRQLEKLGGSSIEKCLKEMCNVAEERYWMNISCETDDESFVSGHKSNDKFTDVEILRRKMVGVSKGTLLDRIEVKHGSMSSTTSSSSVAGSIFNSEIVELPESSSACTQQHYQESISKEGNKYSGHCKAIVPRIVEQLRAGTEQLSQMQEMLSRVRDEIEELHASRDFWEDRALDYDKEIQSLHSAVEEWRQKSVTCETNSNELQTKMSELKMELEKLRIEQDVEATRAKDFLSISQNSQIEKEKHVVLCRLKENCGAKEKESKLEILKDETRKAGLIALFQDIGNASMVMS